MARAPRFHIKPLRRNGRRTMRGRIVQIAALLAIGAISLVIIQRPAPATETVNMPFTLCGERGSQGCVIDGDTIMIARRKIRITGYNAPELKGECRAEIALAHQSRAALRDWLNQGPFEMSDGDDPPYDQYGRELRELKRGKEWLADIMLDRQLAQGTGWGFERGGWCR